MRKNISDSAEVKSSAVESNSQRLNGWLAVAAAKVLLQPEEGGGDGIFSDGGRGIGIEGIKWRMRKSNNDSVLLRGVGPHGWRWSTWLASTIGMLEDVVDGGAKLGEGGGGGVGNDEGESARSVGVNGACRPMSTSGGPPGCRGPPGWRCNSGVGCGAANAAKPGSTEAASDGESGRP